jgi:hypothetical protein
MLEAHVARDEEQWRRRKEWLEDRETKWDDGDSDTIVWDGQSRT